MNGPDPAKSDAVNASEQLAQTEAGLVKIRAAKSYIKLPVLISGTSSVYDDPNARTANYLKRLGDGVRTLARQYKCAYISLRSHMQDANVPASAPDDASWIADAYSAGSGFYVHSTSVGNLMPTPLIREALWPPTMTQTSEFQTRNILNPLHLLGIRRYPHYFTAPMADHSCASPDLRPRRNAVFGGRWGRYSGSA